MPVNASDTYYHIRTANNVCVSVDKSLDLDIRKLSPGYSLFFSRAHLAEDMRADPLSCYESNEEAEAVIFTIRHREDLGMVAIHDSRGWPTPIDESITDFLNSYSI